MNQSASGKLSSEKFPSEKFPPNDQCHWVLLFEYDEAVKSANFAGGEFSRG